MLKWILLIFFFLQVKSATILEKDVGIFAGETFTRIGQCHEKQTLVEISIGYNNPLITVCHDEDSDYTLWSHHKLYGKLLGQAEGGGSNSFQTATSFHTSIDVNKCYTQVTQKETLGMLLGSSSFAEKFIQTDKQLFFSRGHLAPNGDFITKSEKTGSYYFLNASPQWQSINGGNWEKLESKLRSMANGTVTLDVWTGSYGVMRLPDENGNNVEVWLGRDLYTGKPVKKLPVHHLMWKVILSLTSALKGSAVAIIMINNPYLGIISKDDILCDDICDKLDWIAWDRKDIVKGYTYCCDVGSFRDAVRYAPDLGVLPLLMNGAGLIQLSKLLLVFVLFILI